MQPSRCSCFSHRMQHAASSFHQWSALLALVTIALVAAAAPVAGHTYPNYAFPKHVRTSHAVSALTLSGEKIAFIRPLPRRAIGVINNNLTFAVELVRTCSGGGGSSSSSNMDCTLYLDGNSAHDLSLPCHQPITVALTAASAGECHSTCTNGHSLFPRCCHSRCGVLHRSVWRRQRHHFHSNHAAGGCSLSFTTLFGAR